MSKKGREFGIEAELGGHKLALIVTASEFPRMGWVLRELGPQALIYPGQQQHARAAIQWLSGPVRQERIFAHLGWTRDGSDWLYLHAGGAVGAHGPRCDRFTELVSGADSRVSLGSRYLNFNFHGNAIILL